MDTVAHCGPSLTGEFARTLILTDVNTGWIHLEALRSNARVHMLKALERAITAIPYQVQGLDCDNGSEFINREVINWAGDLDVFSRVHAPTRRMTRLTWNRRIIMWCVNTVSITATTAYRH